MTPEEIQRLLATSKLSPEEQQRLQGVFGQQANINSNAYDASVTDVQQNNRAKLRAKAEDLKQRGGQMFADAKEQLAAPGNLLTTAAGADRVQRGMGGKSGAAFGGIGTLLSGDPLGAVVSTPVGMGAGAVANRVTTALTAPLMGMGTFGKAAGTLARVAIPGLVGGGVQQTVANAVGGFKAKAQEAGQYPGGPEVSIGGVPLTEAARVKQQQEREIAMEVKRRQAYGGTDLALDKERLAMQSADYLQRLKGQLPYIQQLKDQELVRMQALNASNTGNSLALGRQAGSFGLARDSQQQAADIFRTALANNPYANAGMAQPTLNYSIG
jgi:hypothetical protein